MDEIINAIVALITAIIGVLGTVYKIGFKKNDERLNEYYKNVLKPFIVEYKKNKKVNAAKFMKNVVKYDDDFVPKYVCSLMNSESKEELKKVLIYDYFEFYCNDSNIMKRIIDKIYKTMTFVIFFFSFVLLFYGIFDFSSGFYMIVPFNIYSVSKNTESAMFENDFQYIVRMLRGILFFFLSILCVKIASDSNEDIYTVKKKKIKKLINKRVKTYDKKIETVVL